MENIQCYDSADPVSLADSYLCAGDVFGLKANSTMRRLWIGCNFTHGKCKLDGCPGNRFKPSKQRQCKNNLVYIVKVRGDDKCLRVGDEVVLRIWDPVAEQSKTIQCNSNGDMCRLSTSCNDASGQFNVLNCHSDILRLNVTGRERGDLLKHKDKISLMYTHSNSQLQCELTNRKVCKRRSCAAESSEEENNSVAEESDVVNPAVQSEHCNHKFTVYQLAR